MNGPFWRRVLLFFALTLLATLVLRGLPRPRPRGGERARPGQGRARAHPQREAGVRIPVPPDRVHVADGDTIRIDWPRPPAEVVRILGIDAPEIRHTGYPGTHEQPYGRESRDFARRHILGARSLELLRARSPDRFGRALGYLFVDGANYSVLAIENHLAEPTIDRFGDSGLPEEAAEVREAARRAGAMPFESPKHFRDRTNYSQVLTP